MPREVNIDQVAALYRAAFDHVCEQENWKGPIDAVVPYNMANVYMQGIEFMTGVRPVGIGRTTTAGIVDGYRIKCDGYWAGQSAQSGSPVNPMHGFVPNTPDRVIDVIRKCGGDIRSECSPFPKLYWATAVASGETVLGYWEWVCAMAEHAGSSIDDLMA